MLRAECASDEYALKGNNGKYLIYDAAGEKYLWSTSDGIGQAKRFTIKRLPTEPFGINSVQLIKDDMALPHQSYLHGVPASLDWYDEPRLAWGNEPPLDWMTITT